MSPLNCNEFESRLREIVETRTSAADDLREHLADCRSCAGLWEDHELMNRAVAEWNAATPKVDLVDRVAGAWRAEFVKPVQPPVETPAKPAAGILAVVTVAVLLLAVTLLATRPDNGGSKSKPDSRAIIAKTGSNQKSVTPPANADSPAVDVEKMVAGFQSQFSLLKNDVSTMVAGVKVEWPAIETNLLGGANAKSVSPVTPKTQKSAGWQTGLNPIQRDVRKAFGFLRQAIPNFEDPPT